MKHMRIVGLGAHQIIFQESTNGRAWVQKTLRSDLFEDYMEENFPAYYSDFMNSTLDMSAAEFFYHYGETPEMRRKGEAFIYTVSA